MRFEGIRASDCEEDEDQKYLLGFRLERERGSGGFGNRK